MFMNRERELEQDNDDLERTERYAICFFSSALCFLPARDGTNWLIISIFFLSLACIHFFPFIPNNKQSGEMVSAGTGEKVQRGIGANCHFGRRSVHQGCYGGRGPETEGRAERWESRRCFVSLQPHQEDDADSFLFFFLLLRTLDANVELAVMKSNQQSTMKNHSTSSLSSYSGSTSSLIGETTPIKSPMIGSHEAMPSLRARLAKNNALQRASSVPGGQSTLRLPPGTAREAGSVSMVAINTPHQNPVKMVQEMVGRVKVFYPTQHLKLLFVCS